MAWMDEVIAVHVAVTDAVSHVTRLKSNRYFVWQEDGENVLAAENGHGERAVSGSTDLYTKIEFDPWVEEFEEAMERAEMAYRYTFVEWEEDTGFYHHAWDWEMAVHG